jgi:hypothetical protein
MDIRQALVIRPPRYRADDGTSANSRGGWPQGIGTKKAEFKGATSMNSVQKYRVAAAGLAAGCLAVLLAGCGTATSGGDERPVDHNPDGRVATEVRSRLAGEARARWHPTDPGLPHEPIRAECRAGTRARPGARRLRSRSGPPNRMGPGWRSGVRTLVFRGPAPAFGRPLPSERLGLFPGKGAVVIAMSVTSSACPVQSAPPPAISRRLLDSRQPSFHRGVHAADRARSHSLPRACATWC